MTEVLNEMAQAAFKYSKMGMRLVPIEPMKKFPLSASWGRNTLDTPEDAFAFYQEKPNWNMGVALGTSNLCSLDIDCMDSFKKILEDFDIDFEAELSHYPRIKGASKGCRLMFQVPDGASFPYCKVNWPKQDNTGHYTVFELRSSTDGAQRQDVLPPSIHPDTGKPYIWEVPIPERLPHPPKFIQSIWEAFECFKPQMIESCPWKEPEQPRVINSRPQREYAEGESVIDKYNAEVSLEHNLVKYGYSRRGKRWLSPHSTTGLAGVRLFDDNTCWISHASDPLCSEDTGQKVSAFDLFRQFEFDGDYTESVKQAAEILGMNNNYEAPTADISGFLDRLRSNAEPNRIQSNADEDAEFTVPDAPKAFNKLTGVIASGVEHTLKTAPKPLVLPTIEAMHVAVAHVLGRHFCTDGAADGTYANLYSMIIADTGQGKEAVKKTLTKLLRVNKMSDQVSAMATSKGALATMLHASPTITMVSDEIGHTLSAASGNKSNANLTGMMAGMLELYGASSQGGEFAPDAMSLMSEIKKGDKAEVDSGFRLSIDQPFFSNFGITTPYMLMDNVNQELVESGWLNRYLIVMPTEGRQLRKRQAPLQYPKAIIDWAEKIGRRCKMKSTGSKSVENMDSGHKSAPKPIVLPLSEKSANLLDEYEMFCMGQMDKYEKYRLHHLFSRSSLLAEKYALIHSLSKNPYAELVDEDSTEWAIEWVKHHQQVFIDLYLAESVSSPRERLIKEVAQSFGDKVMTLSELKNIQVFKAMTTKERNKQLQDLVDDDILLPVAPESGTKGRPSVRYKLYSKSTKEEKSATIKWLESLKK